MLKCAKLCLIVALTILGTATAGRADSVTVRGSVDGSSCVPFGCSPGSIYQQVFARGSFPNLFEIRGVDFFNRIKDSGGDQYIDPAHYELWVSTTRVGLNALDEHDFAANRGSDATRVFAGDLGGTAAGEVPPGPNATLSFHWSDPFHYDRRRGNLLVEVRKTGGSFFGDDGTYLDFSASMKDSSSVSDFEGTTFWNNRSAGLIARLNGVFGPAVDAPAPIPEPGTMILLGVGLMGVAVRARRSAASAE
ncbi:MAG: hypothetical protein V7647_1812 [Acidobacteriota bacterium]|jgi:hypothetical protein